MINESTGLKTKTGKNIFENDLFKYKKHKGYLLQSFTGKVVWIQESGCWGYQNMLMGAFALQKPFALIDELQSDFLNHITLFKL